MANYDLNSGYKQYIYYIVRFNNQFLIKKT